MRNNAPAISMPRDPWRNYLLVLQAISIVGTWLSFQNALVFVLSFGMFHSLQNVLSSWIVGLYMAGLIAVDVWALVDVVRRHTNSYHPIRISVSMTVALWVFALITSGGTWQNIVFYTVVAAFSWTKIIAVQRMLFMTSVRIPVPSTASKKTARKVIRKKK